MFDSRRLHHCKEFEPLPRCSSAERPLQVGGKPSREAVRYANWSGSSASGWPCDCSQASVNLLAAEAGAAVDRIPSAALFSSTPALRFGSASRGAKVVSGPKITVRKKTIKLRCRVHDLIGGGILLAAAQREKVAPRIFCDTWRPPRHHPTHPAPRLPTTAD
jgi:hypothetical protein